MKKISFYLCVLVLSCFSIVNTVDAQKAPKHVYDEKRLTAFPSTSRLPTKKWVGNC